MFHSDWAQDCTLTGGSCWDSVAGKSRMSPSRSSAWVTPTTLLLMVKMWVVPILPEGNLCYKAQNCQLCTGSHVRLLTLVLNPEIFERKWQKNPNNKTQKYLKKNPPPPLLYLKEIQLSWWLWDSWLWKQDQGRKPSPRARQWTASLFQNIREKEKEISRQKPPAELKCVLHGKDKHMSNTAFEFILSAPLNYINGNRDLDISIAALF